MTDATLYGSLTSPYARLCRLVRIRCGAEARTVFEQADPFDPAFRARNPLAKVPALLLTDGTGCFETTLICRTLMGFGISLLPADPHEIIREQADVALLMGVLDLGVAHRLEFLRPAGEQSAKWQARRLDGIHAALPLVEAAALRAARRPEGYGAAALASTLDWLDFRMASLVEWRRGAPAAAEILEQMNQREDVASTDPRVG